MLWSTGAAKGRPYGDGYLTSRNTFQKYFSQGELQNFIESVLDEQAIPVGPGVFFVFKDRYLEQQFLSSRQSDPSEHLGCWPRESLCREPSEPRGQSKRNRKGSHAPGRGPGDLALRAPARAPAGGS